MKKRFVQLLVLLLLLSFSLNAAAYKYTPPYDAVDGGRAAQNMPGIFSVDTADKIVAASADFNSDDSLVNLTCLTREASWWELSDGSAKITKTGTTAASSVVFKYAPAGGLVPGELYTLTCRIKTENISGGAPRNILSAYKDGTWLDETHSYDGKGDVTGTTDWYTMTQILKVPDGTTNLRLNLNLQASMTGTVYFDDLKLYRIARDPMESVLLKPNYKGLVFGDGTGDISLDVVIREQEGFYDTEDMSLLVKLIDGDDNIIYESKPAALQDRMNFVFSSKGLAEGDYYLQSILSDKETGEVISQKEHTIRKRSESYRPDTYVDENGHLIRNGKKTFLKRITGYNGGYQEIAEAALDMNVDSLAHYGMWWATGSETDAIDYMRNNNLKTQICLSSYWFSDLSGNEGTSFIKQQSDILPFFKQITDDYKDDSVLEAYYVFDEPDPVTKGEEIRWNNEILAQYDINHPTIGTADKGYDEYGIYCKMTDILCIDPYPVRGSDSDNLAVIGKNIRKVKENFPNRPVFLTLQGFHYSSRGDLRSPTYDELRNMAWQAICEGAEGFDCYSYTAMKSDTTKDLETWKSEINSLYTEVEGYEQVILSDEPTPSYTVENGGEWLNISLRHYNGKTYIFAVNNTGEEHNATVKIEGKGDVSLEFSPLEVIIEEISQDSFVSNKAELKAISFSNGSEVFAVGEGSENILYVPKDSGVINLSAQISDGAKLYIGGVEKSANDKITVRIADSFTVTVVAEDGTEKTTSKFIVVKQ